MDARVWNDVVRLSGAAAWVVTGTACPSDSRPVASDTTGETGIVTVTAVNESTDDGSGSAGTTTSSFEGTGASTGLESGFNLENTTSCPSFQVDVARVIPTLVLLVDQSSSMDVDFQGEPRWEAVYTTLMDPAEGVVAQLQSSVRFGLTLYSSVNGFQGGECPLLTTVPPALDNHDAIDAVFASAETISETPTGESLEAVALELAAFSEEGPKGIVLATDGEPDTCAQPNPQNGQETSLLAAEAAFAAGIQTFIISVGGEVSDHHLQQMANVGVGRERNDTNPAPFYRALDAEELIGAFNTIVGSFVECRFSIDGVVELADACEGTVTLDGEDLVCGEDWEVTDSSTLELFGEACERLQDGSQHEVDAQWPCDVVSPIP